MKFLRQYKLEVEMFNQDNTQLNGVLQPREYLTIAGNLTLDIDISKQSLSTSQVGNFKIYNLNEKHRNAIYKDRSINTNDIRAMKLFAGYYGEPMSLVFAGVLRECNSYKAEGTNDIITEIEAFDGGYPIANCTASVELPKESTDKDKLKELANWLPTIKEVVIGSFPKQGLRGESVTFVWDAITKICPKAFIESNRLICLNDTEYLPSILYLPAENILGSPKKNDTRVEVEILFEPRTIMGGVVVLNSKLNTMLNGPWRVYSIHHHGTISNAVDGGLTTKLELWRFDPRIRDIQSLPAVKVDTYTTTFKKPQ